MDDRLKMALGLGALGVGGYLLLTKTGVLASQTPTGLRPVPHQPSEEEIQPGYINIEIPPLTESEDPLETDVPQADWPPNQTAAYMFVKFLDAYEEYAKHRLPFALSRMRNYVMRMQGSAYSHLTRADLWTSDQLKKLVAKYRWEYGIPHKKILYPEDWVKTHVFEAKGSRFVPPPYLTSKRATVRDIVTQLLYDAQAGRLYPVPAVRAVLLPWYTVAQGQRVSTGLFQTYRLTSEIATITNTYEWECFWTQRGLRVEYCGSKGFRSSSHGYHTWNPPGEFVYFCVRG